MNGRKYEELEDWEKEFYDLNMDIGNNVWGARLEPDGAQSYKLRVFINHEKFESEVLEKTNGTLAGYPLVFTVYSQEEYAKSLEETENNVIREKSEESEAPT